MTLPRNVSALQRGIRLISASNENAAHMQLIMANVIAGQFLVGAVMRGGASLKLRYGDAVTRYTMDFDASRSIPEDEFIENYNKRLSLGWNGFSGRVVRMPKPRPRNVPGEYVMQPFEIKLTYNNRPWCTVDLELSYNEVGDADAFDIIPIPSEIIDGFCKLGFPEPAPFPLMKISHQIAQKLHGVTDPDYVRAQDLIDLQLMLAREKIDFAEVHAVCMRLFANRRKHSWPPVPDTSSEEWRTSYGRLMAGLSVLSTIEDATAWLNKLIKRIGRAGVGIQK